MFDPTIHHHLAEKDMTRLGQNQGITTTSTNWYCNNNNDQEIIQFTTSHTQEEENDDSGFCSPPLWNNSPGPSSSSQPLLNHHVSRLQAITKGQRELMEIVKNLPESYYELSLQDLVENHHTQPQPESQPQFQSQPQASPLGQGVSTRYTKEGTRKNMKSSGSFEIESTGLFLKMGFPFSMRLKKRNKSGGSGSGRISPRPEGVKGGSSGGGERDWWKKKFTGSSDSDSSRASINSSSTGSSGHSYGVNRNKNRSNLSSSCWTLFTSRGSKYLD